MALDLNKNHNYNFCLSRKRCFLILLLFNSIIAYTYYTHGHNQSKHIENTAIKSRHININSKQKQYSSETTEPIDFIRNILENEYNYDDLVTFYNLVQKEFSLGLRCTRKPIKLETTTQYNYTNNTQINNNITEIRSLPTTTTTTTTTTSQINHSYISLSRRNHRTSLYSYTIDNFDACLNESIDLLIIIISKSDNYKTRDAIRRTWGSGKNLGNYSSINMKIFFLIDFDEKLISNIRLENNLFHDIIQVELPPQYTLVTYRVLSIFEWSFRYCRHAKFLFKTDDDIFINLILLLKFISPYLKQNINNSFHISDMNIYGYKHYHPGVFRQANDPVGARYVITMDEFPCAHYPDFLSGFGYLIPKKARDALIYASYQDPNRPFRISDVYLTGILPDYLSLQRQPMFDYNIRYQGNCENFFEHPKSFACAVGLHHGDTSDVFDKFNRYWQCVKKFL
ncbi:unnamed protein product [Rotaria sp. Silwood1]|nr:unnamed protein product [Rotaria sp. Silwood1]CAF3638017.1 unnamed protein product [Rotaria sp. Silwood1]CAF4592237.1 unnamed protein product [Rotaria sp. Silwood1]